MKNESLWISYINENVQQYSYVAGKTEQRKKKKTKKKKQKKENVRINKKQRKQKNVGFSNK